ncbi:MAG: valine--tRNA ligase [Gammaproteobacteria bacterium]
MTDQISKSFNPTEMTEKWYRIWEQHGYFKPAEGSVEPVESGEPAPSEAAEAFCILLPPPNITGTLHMGHGFQVSIMDTLIRYQRMLGKDVLWQGGVDHAGIATQMVVERQLEAEGSSREQIGRAAFVDRVWKWKEQSGGTISRQLRKLGASIDWSRERFTMDADYSQAVTQAFVALHQQGLIYRQQKLVNWDPVLQTALSDLEVVSEEEQGKIYRVLYPFVEPQASGQKGVVIATTRPETILVDGAIAVHPDDQRYHDLLGQRVWVPMTNPPRAIPIIADPHVDPEFGTGCVKITPAHDFNDYEVYQRHPDAGIPLLVLMDSNASLTDQAPAQYSGLDRYEARKRIVADLEQQGLLVSVAAHTYVLPRGDRSGAVLEPMLTWQWYMRMDDLATAGIDAVHTGAVDFIPEQWQNTYLDWLNNIQDWCLSRQLWWGHRIPAWYTDHTDHAEASAGDTEGEQPIYVAHSEQEALIQAQADGYTGALRQDNDVLDTWFSSALWSFATLGWPDNSSYVNRFYPTSVLVTGFDIIFFWVARMIMMGQHFQGRVPFEKVYVHGLVRDARGQKMSKSKGNILDPIDLIEGIGLEDLITKRTHGLMQPKMRNQIIKTTRQDYPSGLKACGVDALRFTFCALATTNRNINFDTSQIEGYRNFCNKIWNAARLVEQRVASADRASIHAFIQTQKSSGLAECWILSELNATVIKVRESLDNYRLDWASQALYHFIWHQFCDWYLECSKAELESNAASERVLEIQSVMVQVLEQILRLAHPFMPFISEELWQKVAPWALPTPADSLMLASYPEPRAHYQNAEAVRQFEWLSAIVSKIRQMRTEHQVHPAQVVHWSIADCSQEQQQRLEKHQTLICSLAKVHPPEYQQGSAPTAAGENHQVAGLAQTALGELQILLNTGGAVDADTERNRIESEMARLEKGAAIWRAKLANPNFAQRAPEQLVASVTAQLEEADSRITSLKVQLQALSS